MIISLHPTRGKSTAPDVLVQMGRGWQNIDVTWQEAFELITVDGYATSAEVFDGHRINQNFISRQLIMVDIDNENQDAKLSVEQLKQHDFYKQYGAGYYATHSYKPEQERFRICFVLEKAETDFERTKKLIRALLKIFPAGDPACKDPVRLFYGSPNCTVCERTDRVLPVDVVEQMIDDIVAEDFAKSSPPPSTKSYTPASNIDVGELLDELKNQYFDLPYEIRSRVVWAVMSVCDPATTLQMMRSRWPDNNKTYPYESFIRDGAKPYNGKRVSIGTLFTMVRKNNPKWTLSKYKNNATVIFNIRTIKDV